MDGPITRGLHHVALVCADARRTLRFYRDLLGLRLLKRAEAGTGSDAYHLYLGDRAGSPGTIVAFFVWPDARRGRWGVGGMHHIALGVRDEAELLKWKRWLNDRDVAVSGPFDRRWFKSIYFTDPDGQVLELATEGPGYDLDEPADALGKEVIIPPREVLRGGRDEAAIRERTHPEPVPAIDADMQLTGIHHVTGLTDDIDAAHAFYTKALGLRRVKKSVNQDDPSTPHHFWAVYDGARVEPRSAITLFGWPASTRTARDGPGQTHHIAYRAQDEAELDRFRERLLDMGEDVSDVQDRTYFRSISFYAPDGQRIEIATDGPGFAED